jgi:hypothetical protein
VAKAAGSGEDEDSSASDYAYFDEVLAPQGDPLVRMSDDMGSCTRALESVDVDADGKVMVFCDTPGFGDTGDGLRQ